MDDCDVYNKFPKLRKWFNKLWLSETLGYNCGPCGTTPSKKGKYVVRPIYNLSGMSHGASIKKLKPNDYSKVKSGYFWCERFEGKHYSVDYKWTDDTQTGGWWTPISCYQGTNFPIDLSRFSEWTKVDNHLPKLPEKHRDLWKEIGYNKCQYINVEWINYNIIELHLRKGNIYDYDQMIPVWSSWPEGVVTHYELNGYKFIKDYEDADGQLDDPREGFMVK